MLGIESDDETLPQYTPELDDIQQYRNAVLVEIAPLIYAETDFPADAASLRQMSSLGQHHGLGRGKFHEQFADDTEGRESYWNYVYAMGRLSQFLQRALEVEPSAQAFRQDIRDRIRSSVEARRAQKREKRNTWQPFQPGTPVHLKTDANGEVSQFLGSAQYRFCGMCKSLFALNAPMFYIGDSEGDKIPTLCCLNCVDNFKEHTPTTRA